MLYNTIQCRYARSLGGGFEGSPNQVWATTDYTDRSKPVVFCGLYDMRDYYALWRHKGRAFVFWCGSDIRNLANGFAFNDGKLGKLSRLTKGLFNKYIIRLLRKHEHWVENGVEKQALLDLGIESSVCPSFFGDVDKFKSGYFWNKNPNVYISCGKGRQKEYGFGIIDKIAPKLPNIWFHLYGDDWQPKSPNVIIHGRVPIETMNEETKNMQCGLRLNEFDGFSEILAKAVLRGHYAISKIPYPLIPSYNDEEELVAYLSSLTRTYQPNVKAEKYYRQVLNSFPWCL